MIIRNERYSVPFLEPLEQRRLLSATYFVSTRGKDLNSGIDSAHPWRHIQKAFDSATPGSTVEVAAGRYREKLTLHVSGSQPEGFITFQATGRAVIDGKNIGGHNLLSIVDRSYVRIIGFEWVNDVHVSDGSGIRIEGSASHIELLHNRIHHITGSDAMGITVYGSDPVSGIHDLVIDGNEIYDCDPAHSEALTLNGNVTHFSVTNNIVHDVNNIGICFIGAEGMSSDPSTDAARDGVCSGNQVRKARSSYGGGYAAGIYVDGGRDIVLERNTVTQSDLGIEVGCEHAGKTASGIIVRDNLIYENDKAGLVFGGYDVSVGRVVNCSFNNNTLYKNDRLHLGNGELWIQYASGNTIENNLFYATDQALLINAEAGATNNQSDFNLFFAKGGRNRQWTWEGIDYVTLEGFQIASAQDAHSGYADPLLARPQKHDLHLVPSSPALDAGDPLLQPASDETDVDGQARLAGSRIDIGADELT